MTELTDHEKFKRALAGDAVMMGTLANTVAEKYGSEGLEALRDGLEKAYRPLMTHLAGEVGARTGDGGIEDWAKLERLICDILGAEYQIETTPTRGSLKASYCPMASQYRRIAPDFCPLVLIGVERAIASTINPRMKVHGAQYIPKGDDYCEIVCELKEETE